ncbi:hypothetical protein OY671_012096, partial [Metschnikowia pulcherrima]
RQRPRLFGAGVRPAVGARRRPAGHHHDRPGKRHPHRPHHRGRGRQPSAAGHARRLWLCRQAVGHDQPPARRQAVHHAGGGRRAAAPGAAVRGRHATGAAVAEGQVPGVRAGRTQVAVRRRTRHHPDGAGWRRQARPDRADRRARPARGRHLPQQA